MRTTVLAVVAALALFGAAPAAASPSPQVVELWWLNPSVWRHEQVRIDVSGQVQNRYRSPAGFWTWWYQLPATADPAGELTVDGQTGLVKLQEPTAVLRVTGTDGQPLCSDGPDWGAFYRC